MKRPFATIGFSMLVTFLAVTNISHNLTVALLSGATVAFCLFILLKPLRKYKTVIFSLLGVILFMLSFVSEEKFYTGQRDLLSSPQTIKGVVCQTPAQSDYAHSYIIKCENNNYKIRFVAVEDKFLNEGDCVTIVTDKYEMATDEEFLKNSLSSKVYFTFFESDECFIKKTGKTNYIYKNIGAVKRSFSNIISEYLPGENGAIAKAMTIGDKDGIDDNTVDSFNYCGTSHLLVISGLHLTLWSLGIIKLLNKFSYTRKISTIIGIICLLGYSAITGFSVSVLRACAMVGTVLVAKIFRRDADSINSIGTAVTFILLFNPFAPFSVSLWFTVLSTVGILAFSEKIQFWLQEKIKNANAKKSYFHSAVITSVAISLSTTVFTLPVFIVKFKMLPVASIFANLLMVDAAMLLMILTVAGAFAHLIFLHPVSKICFLVVGFIGKFLRFVAEKIGMAPWSTILLNHKFYEYFLLFFILCVCAVFIARKYKKNIAKHISVLLSVVFIIISFYCTSYEYNTPSVEIAFTNTTPVMTINSRNKRVLVGTVKETDNYKLKSLINRHNKKELDGVAVTHIDGNTVSELINLKNTFNVKEIYFYKNSPEIFRNYSKNNVTAFSVGGNVSINLENCEKYIEIVSRDKSVLIYDCEKAENLFENNKMYDIILIYGNNASEFEKSMEKYLKDNNGELIVAKENQTVSVYFERQEKSKWH